MPKIAMIGAGSIVFCKTLMMDILATPALRDSEFCLMSRTTPKLERIKKFADRVIKDNGLNARVSITTDRRTALKEADYVIVMLQIGGVNAFKMDYEIPMKYGVDQCVGDTICAGGILYGQRGISALMEFCRDIREVRRHCLNHLHMIPYGIQDGIHPARRGGGVLGGFHHADLPQRDVFRQVDAVYGMSPVFLRREGRRDGLV